MFKANKLTYTLAAIAAVLFFIFSSFWGGGVATVHAVASPTAFDETDVMDDLQTATVNGKSFNVIDYPYDSTGVVKHPEIMTVVEYCYSVRPSQRGNYGVYIYFYNPQGLNIRTDSGANKITLGVKYSEDSDGNLKVVDYEKFALKFCSKSTGDYRDLFYKFKVIDHKSADGKTIAERVNSNARRYDISEVELLKYGDRNATAYDVGGTYTFTGYAKGYSADQNAESTLECERTDLETVTLDLAGVTDGVDKRTYWRSTSSSKGKNYQNQINSVFFAIDTNLLEKYGYTLQRIKAEWWEYKTVPVLVVGNDTIRDKLLEYAGENIGESYDESRGYSIYNREDELTWLLGSEIMHYYSYCWNIDQTKFKGEYNFSSELDHFLSSLPLVFSSGDISVDNYTLSAETLKTYCEQYDKSYNNGHLQFNAHNFSADLFMNSVDDGRTRGYNLREFDISNPDDLWQINSYDSNHSWWHKLWDYGFWAPTTDDGYADVLPIQMLKAEDFAVSNVADHLKINPDDVNKLKDFYNSSVKDGNNDGKPDNAVFLFRYALTDYWAQDVVVTNAGDIYTKEPSAELRQGTQFFDFDILTMTFNKDGDLVTLGCVSSPVDHWSAYTPSIEGKEPDWWKWLMLALGLLLAIIIIVLLWPILGPVIGFIVKGVIWLITAPFKAIAAAVKKRKRGD